MKMSGSESAAVARGIELFNEALAMLGQPPLDRNGFFVAGDPQFEVFPVYHLKKNGVAPLTFVFGSTFEVWVGPFSEVIVEPVDREHEAAICQLAQRVLHSSVSVKRGFAWIKISFWEAGSPPWRVLRVIGPAEGAKALGHFKPFLP